MHTGTGTYPSLSLQLGTSVMMYRQQLPVPTFFCRYQYLDTDPAPGGEKMRIRIYQCCGARAGAGAKIMEKVEPELEPKLNNFGSATLQYRYTVLRLSHVTEK